MTQTAEAAPPARPARLRLGAGLAHSVGLLPFAVFATLFLLIPTIFIVVGAFRGPDGGFTLQNMLELNTETTRVAFWNSIKVSVLSALLGGAIGFAMAAAAVLGGVPRWVRSPLLTFSGVASNFAGVPLAFAFIATVGPAGLITLWLKTSLGINLRAWGFNLLSTQGLIVTYLFFQIPLMVLIITPALDGLKREWREAAAVLGATGPQYWRMVALPVLMPSLIGAFALLFANAFGAVATAMALAGPTLNIVPIRLFAQIRGDVLGNPAAGYAIATGMILITAVANAVYIVLRTRSERWLK